MKTKRKKKSNKTKGRPDADCWMSVTTGGNQDMWLQCSFRRQNLRKTDSGRPDQFCWTASHRLEHSAAFLCPEKQEGGEEKDSSNFGRRFRKPPVKELPQNPLISRPQHQDLDGSLDSPFFSCSQYL